MKIILWLSGAILLLAVIGSLNAPKTARGPVIDCRAFTGAEPCGLQFAGYAAHVLSGATWCQTDAGRLLRLANGIGAAIASVTPAGAERDRAVAFARLSGEATLQRLQSGRERLDCQTVPPILAEIERKMGL